MKTLIKNKYFIDFSIVTNMEDMGDSMKIDLFGGNSIEIKKQDLCTNKIDFETSYEEYEKHKKEINDLVNNENYTFNHIVVRGKAICRFMLINDKISFDEEWEKDKKFIIETWNKTESVIKDIQIYN